jgi:hypothetical protein
LFEQDSGREQGKNEVSPVLRNGLKKHGLEQMMLKAMFVITRLIKL